MLRMLVDRFVLERIRCVSFAVEKKGRKGKKERKEKILCRVDKNIKEGSLHSWMDRDRAFHRHLSWSTPSIILANFLGVIQAGPRKLPSLNHTILVVEIISCGKKG